MSGHRWKPITPLSDADRNTDLAAMKPLYDSWELARSRLSDAGATAVQKFVERLVRRMSIETGILERLYDLDRGTTEALVAAGFAEDLVSRADTNIEPDRLIDYLRDQEAAIQLVIDCVSGKRPLTKGVMHELHSILTRHQDTTTAVDQFGRRVEIPLLKGAFKQQPNNPRRGDGSLHEYSPPMHVESEVDNLLVWLAAYDDEDPVVVASWLHHRFTQIHPYQDGNGRVARALVTLVLLRRDLLPLVIDRDLRAEYLDALEQADRGDLSKLATIFARLERAAILEALSIDIEGEIERDRTLTSAVIQSLANKFNARRQVKHAELRRVNELALRLRLRSRRMAERAFNELARPLGYIGEPEIRIHDGGPDRDNAHWYKLEVVESARRAAKHANFGEAHYFIKASLKIGGERLVLVVSFHHVGRELSGIMEATAFARMESFEDEDTSASPRREFFVASLEPFVFTYRTEESQISASFDRWLDAAFAVAIKEFGDRL